MKPRPSGLALVLVLSAIAPLSAHATEQILHLDPAGTQVAFELPATGHDVHGVFVLRSGDIHFDAATGTASGELLVDAASAKTGNGSRDKTMHGEVLESSKFPLFRFTAERLEGTLAATGESHVTLHGKLAIHGADHPMALPATVSVNGDQIQVKTRFSVPFVAWGMEDPSFLMFRVEKEVAVTVQAKGRLEGVTVDAASGASR
ncbi:MAG TPA: YceI family protein [Thermoanaerobaculia bacterium]|nr:YceI family protein [Thermoanaerobaculia bacterium]